MTATTPLVLIVDDEPPLVALVARMLDGQGYQLLTAGSPDDALRVAATAGRPIALLVTDLQMPGMTGRMLSRRLLETNPGMKVLYVTGHSDALFDAAVLLDDHEAFLEKPITLSGAREAASLRLFGTLKAPTAVA